MNENAAVATAASVAAEEKQQQQQQQQQQEEKEEEKDENEEESWAMGLANAELQEGALEPILDTTMARPRIGKGVFFMILVDAE